MNAIIQRPIVTEKSMQEAARGRFSFVVSVSANKDAIRAEIKRLFHVTPIAVRTVVVKGGVKRSQRLRKTIKVADYKKAVVVLKAGDKIDLFDVGPANQAAEGGTK